jgi:hypothetical protein
MVQNLNGLQLFVQEVEAAGSAALTRAPTARWRASRLPSASPSGMGTVGKRDPHGFPPPPVASAH